jgi:hypothetical protein
VSDELFDLTPSDAPVSRPLIVWPEGKVSKRTLAWRAGAVRRLASIHGKFGHGREGNTCKGCVHLIRRHGNTKSFLKCELYRRDGYEGTDWQARWPACGAWTMTPIRDRA